MNDYKDYGYKNNQPRHSFSYLTGPLLSMLAKKNNNCIIDLGCGNGYLVELLLSEGYNAYGTDASVDGITIARENYPDRFFLQDLSTDVLPEQFSVLHFDTIISTEVIEHLYDPQGFIDLCKRLLNGKGEVIISTPYHGYLKNLMLSLFDRWDSHFDPLWHGGHIKYWSRKTLTSLLTRSGFEVVAFKGCGRIPYFWKSMIIKAKIG